MSLPDYDDDIIVGYYINFVCYGIIDQSMGKCWNHKLT